MRKPTICIRENNDADQLRGNRRIIIIIMTLFKEEAQLAYYHPIFPGVSEAADQCLCFCNRDNTKPLITKSKVSSL